MNIGFFNGEFIEVDKAVIPIDERGHQFGDGVYEVVKVYPTGPFLMDEHLARLENSASTIKLKVPYTREEIKNFIKEGMSRSELSEAEVYFQVTRGIAVRNHLFPNVPAAFSMTIRPPRKMQEGHYEKGVSAILFSDERWANCHIKSLNLLPNILAKQEANSNGSFEAILVRDGYVTEGTSSNVFAVKNGILYTTPLTSNILPGVTRGAILKLAKDNSIPYIEETFTPEFLINADEVFITSTSIEILSICSINNQFIASGKPGKITKLLHACFQLLYSNKEGIPK